MVDVVNRGMSPGDPVADTAYDAFGKVNTKFDLLDAADAALAQADAAMALAIMGKADAAATASALADKADAAATSAALAERVVGPAASTDNAAARFDLATGKLLQDSALLIADTTAALSRAGGGGVAVQGTGVDDNAAAGFIGQIVEASRVQGSALAMTTVTRADIASILLTAGDWDVTGSLYAQLAATTTIADLIGNFSTTSAAADFTPGRFMRHRCASFAPGATSLGYPLPTARWSLAVTTTIYLVGYVDFGVSTCGAWGNIRARRVR